MCGFFVVVVAGCRVTIALFGRTKKTELAAPYHLFCSEIDREKGVRDGWKEYLETEYVLQEVEDVNERFSGLRVSGEAVGRGGGIAVCLLQVRDSELNLVDQRKA